VLTLPYVTTASFKAHPTYLDLLNLRSGDASAAHQDAELLNVLLMASTAADNYCQMGEPDGTLAAHVKTEHQQIRPNQYGELRFHPAHIPLLWVSSLSYGYNFTSLQTVTDPAVWVEEGRNVVACLGTGGLNWPARQRYDTRTQLFTSWVYTAGFVNTLLAGDTAPGDTTITVTDPTGITGGTSNTPATMLRIWDPGAEESATVAGSYVTGSTTVPLTAPLVNAHSVTTTPVGVSALPAEAHLAVIQWTVALLMRPNSKAVSQFKGSAMRLSLAGDDDAWGDASGLVKAGRAALMPYRRIV
jgi:hypothetical protein